MMILKNLVMLMIVTLIKRNESDESVKNRTMKILNKLENSNLNA